MDIRDAFYHGVRHQVRRVLEAMGPERIERGLTAFENGASNWSHCFFARAYPELSLNSGRAEFQVAQALGMGTNRVPMRIVYTLFDGVGSKTTMTKGDLRKFIEGFLDEKRDPEVQKAIDDLIRSTDFSTAHDTTHTVFAGQSC